MVAEMAEAGVKPNVATYDRVARQLMLEGNFEEARAVVETEMPAAGVVLDDGMHVLFERSERECNGMWTKHLEDLLKRGSPEAKQKAQDFFDVLRVNGVADEDHQSLMQRPRECAKACLISDTDLTNCLEPSSNFLVHLNTSTINCAIMIIK